VTDLRRVHRLPGSLHTKDPANPQLVTFERRYTGPRRELAVIIIGLPEVHEDTALEPPAATAAPIAEIVLRETLSYIDPPADEPIWRRLVAAIKSTPLLDGNGEEVAVDWSAGRLDRTGKYVDSSPENWGGDDIVREKYRAAKAQKTSGKVAAFGSLVWEAWQAGMPRDNRMPREWAEYAAGSHEPASEPGPFLLRIGDLFEWPDPTFLVADFLMQNEDACLYSPPKSGKTFVALDICLSLAAGLPVFGKLNVLRPGEAVVYLSGEGHAGMKRRIMSWGQAQGFTPEQTQNLPFFYKTGVPESEKGMGEALRYIAGIRQFCTPVLVVIDTMARSLGKADESTSVAAHNYLELTGALRKALHTTVLTLAHEGKTEGKGVRGSSAFVAGFDAVWHLEANKDNRTAKLEAEWLKDADELGPHCFRMESVYVEGMTDGKGAVLRYLNLADYKPKKDTSEVSSAMRMQITELLRARGIHTIEVGWTHAQVAEALMPTARPSRNENINSQLGWDTEYQALRQEVRNVIRSKEGKRMGAKKVAQIGHALEWHWFVPKI
jgi:hypothetical protein